MDTALISIGALILVMTTATFVVGVLFLLEWWKMQRTPKVWVDKDSNRTQRRQQQRQQVPQTLPRRPSRTPPPRSKSTGVVTRTRADGKVNVMRAQPVRTVGNFTPSFTIDDGWVGHLIPVPITDLGDKHLCPICKSILKDTYYEPPHRGVVQCVNPSCKNHQRKMHQRCSQTRYGCSG